jgi:hypothetical protein
MTKLGDSSPWHKRLEDFESFDRITLEVVPRFKTSGLSGDEWRQHVEISFFFKGEKVFSTGFTSMRAALMLLGGEWVRAQEPIPLRVIQLEESGLCDQPSCANPSVSKFKLKKEFVRGEEIIRRFAGPGNFRQFCAKHLRRGDSDMEDCDDNYRLLSGPGPGESTNVEESPAGRVTVAIDSLDDLPGAINTALTQKQEKP